MVFRAFAELLAEKSFDAISIQEIAERSTVNRATIYDHFRDKLALLEEMTGEEFQQRCDHLVAQAGGKCAAAAIRAFLLGVCDFFAEALRRNADSSASYAAIVQTRVRSMVRGFLLARFNEHPEMSNAELRASLASWAICGAALEWSQNSARCREAFADTALPLLLPILSTPCGGESTADSHGSTVPS